MPQNRPRSRHIAAIVVAALVLAACGGDDAADTAEAANTVTAPDPTEAPDSNVAETTAPEPDVDELAEPAEAGPPQRESIEVLTLPEGPASFDVLGGLELELPEAATVLVATGCVVIEAPGFTDQAPFPPAATFAEIRFSGSFEATPLSTIDEWLALYDGHPEPLPTGETLSVLGIDFAQYVVEGAFTTGPPPGNRYLNCTANDGFLSELAFLPSPFATVYVAEGDGRLLMIDAGGFDEDDRDFAVAWLDQLLSALSATTG